MYLDKMVPWILPCAVADHADKHNNNLMKTTEIDNKDKKRDRRTSGGFIKSLFG